METVEAKIAALGYVLPQPFKAPPGLPLLFAPVRVSGSRAYVSGHLPTDAEGNLAMPVGKVGSDVSLEQAKTSAALTALAMLGSLQRELGDLSRIQKWLRVFTMTNCAPGFTNTATVANAFSEVLLSVFGQSIGSHARSAVGMAELPLSAPFEAEAELEIIP